MSEFKCDNDYYRKLYFDLVDKLEFYVKCDLEGEGLVHSELICDDLKEIVRNARRASNPKAEL